MNLSPSTQRGLVDQSRRSNVEDILRRYPDVDRDQAAEVLRFVKQGPPLEVGLITADEQLRKQLQRFKGDHAAEFSLGLKEYLVAAVILVVLIGFCVFLWDAGAGR